MEDIDYNFYKFESKKYMNWVGKYTYGSIFFRGGYLYLHPKYGMQIDTNTEIESSQVDLSEINGNALLSEPVFWNDFSHLKLYNSLEKTLHTLVESDKKELSTLISDTFNDIRTLNGDTFIIENDLYTKYNVIDNTFFTGLQGKLNEFPRLINLMNNNYDGKCFMHKKSEYNSVLYFFDDYDSTIEEIKKIISIANANNIDFE